MSKTVELDFFAGRGFELSGVSTGESAVNNAYGDAEDASTITFLLDGRLYQAQEDPSDGYRSSLRDIVVLPGTHTIANTFEPCRVVGEWQDAGDHGSKVILFKSVKTGLTVLEVGTNNVDDYYPCFVGSFSPENMDANLADYVKRAVDDAVSQVQLQAQREAAGWGSF